MDLLWAILIFGGVGLFALGYRPFMENFQEKFGRSFIHVNNILLILLIILSAACKSGNAGWTVTFYIAYAIGATHLP